MWIMWWGRPQTPSWGMILDGKILSYANLLASAMLAGAYGQSNLRQCLHAFLGYRYMRIEQLFGVFSSRDIVSIRAVQTVAVVKLR